MSDTATPAAASRPSAHAWQRFLPLLLIVAGVLVYAPSLGGPFIFDDSHAVTDNQRIRELWPIDRFLRGEIRPVVEITFAINYALGKLDPIGYHLVNIFIHVAAGLTLFGLIRRTLRLPSMAPRWADRATLVATAVALLWVVHPLNTQAVSYIVQRAESLMGLFYLLTLYLFVVGATSGRGRWGWWALCLLSFLIGAFTKEVIATAPLMVLLYDWVFLKRPRESEQSPDLVAAGESAAATRGLAINGSRWVMHLALWGALVAVVILAMTGARGATFTKEHSSVGAALTEILSSWRYFRTQAGVALHYLRLAVWPEPLMLDYGWRPADRPLDYLPQIAVMSLLGLASVVGVVLRKWWGYFGIWFFVVLGPTSSFVPILDLAFEHRMYVPLVGIVVLVVLAVARLLDRAPRPTRHVVGLALCAAAAVLLSWRTMDRNADYQNPVILWQEAAQYRPHNARAFHNLGVALMSQRRFRDAEAALREAIERVPTYHLAHTTLAAVLTEMGRPAEAIESADRALELSPNHPKANYQRGRALMMLGRHREAIVWLDRAVSSDRKYDRAWNDRGLVLASLGQLDEAATSFRRAIDAEPELLTAWVNLAMVLRKMGRGAAALEVIEQADARFDEAQLHLAMERARTLVSMGRLDEAEVILRAMIDADAATGPAWAMLGLVRERRGDGRGAKQAYLNSMSQAPGQAEVARRLVWLMATWPCASVRDAEMSRQIGEQLALRGGATPRDLDVYAAALASAGQYDKAAAMVERAIELAEDDDIEAMEIDAMTDRLKLYRAGRPYRQDAVSPGPSVN